MLSLHKPYVGTFLNSTDLLSFASLLLGGLCLLWVSKDQTESRTAVREYDVEFQ